MNWGTLFTTSKQSFAECCSTASYANTGPSDLILSGKINLIVVLNILIYSTVIITRLKNGVDYTFAKVILII